MTDVKMETSSSTAPPALTPAESERVQFDCQIRLWALRVRFLTQKLLSLGRSYEVRYRLTPPTLASPSPLSVDLPDLGFDVMSLMDSHLLQVKAVKQPRFEHQLVNEKPAFAGVGVPRADDVRAIYVEDYLVGMDTQDFLIAPVPLPQLKKQLQRVRFEQHATGVEKVLVLRFVRLDRLVQVDQKRTHGQVLDVLKHIETQHADLTKNYAALLERNRTVVTRELTREKKLLSYVRIIAVEMKKTVMEDEKFLFAFNFQQWYAAINEAQGDVPDDDDSDDDEADGNDHEAQEQPTFDYDEIEIPDDDNNDDDDDEFGHDRRQPMPEHYDVVDLTIVDAAAPPRMLDLSRSAPRNLGAIGQRSYGKAKPNRPPGLQNPQLPQAEKPARKPSVLRNPDMSWLDHFAAADLKWLPHARALLASFIGGMMDSFEQDGSTHWRIPEVTKSIAEQLLRLYIHKRHTTSIDNSALHKEFARHVRMLRSNLKNTKNGKLREDLLDGAVTTTRLCEMSIDELAPEALRLERERRYELHAQSNTLKTPTGPTLVKTKDGYKEVYFGGITGSQESESQIGDTASGAAAASSEKDTVTDETRDDAHEDLSSAPFEYDGPSVVPPTNASDLPVIQPLSDTATLQQSSELELNRDPANTTADRADEVTEKFQKAMDFQPRSPAVRKRVSFAEDPVASFPNRKTEPKVAAAAVREGAERESEQENRRAKARSLDAKVGRDFVLTLFDPAHDIVGLLRQFVETLKDAPLSTMSREFLLTTDVKLFRDSRPNQDFVYTARLQLAHLVVESVERNERYANIDTVYKLITATEDFKWAFGDLLDQIRQNFSYGAGNDSRQVRDRVFSYLVEKNAVRFAMPTVYRYGRNGVEVEEFEAQISVYGLPIALCRGSNLPVARNEASQEMLSFLVDVLERKASYREPPKRTFISQEEAHPNHVHHQIERPPAVDVSRPVHDEVAVHRYNEDQSMDSDRYMERESDEARNNMYRKRRYEPSRDDRVEKPLQTRRRTDSEPAPAQYSAQDEKLQAPISQVSSTAKVEESEPVFYVDNAGERKPHADRTSKALTEEQRIKVEVDGYQELVAQMFKNRDRVMATLDSIVWDANREIECIVFESKLTVTQVAKWIPSSQTFACELQAFGKRIVARSMDRRLDVAGRNATSDFKRIVDQIYTKWKVLVRTYGDRKKHTPTTLMAGNETRSKNQQFVDLTEKRAGHLYECCIFVNGHLAIRHACLNQKMAKRSASEEFRDVLESFYILEEKKKAAAGTASASNYNQQLRNSSGGAGNSSSSTAVSSSHSASAAGNGQAQRSQPAPRKRASNLVLCSEDEDEDDDDYGSDYSSGSDYGAAVVVKPEKTQADLAAVSMKELIEKEKKAPYDSASESTMPDDAKFRATIRSLFTPSDDLCAGIDKLRGSLKFRGSAENVIVPNVKATIHMERLREGIFEVRVAVNDVIYFVTSEPTKADACNAAIDGMLKKLNEIRSVWVQLLNFFHTKELGLDDIMESFHLLRLANIISITGSIEKPTLARDYNQRAPPPSGVHCALRVGEYVAYRVIGDTEEEARLLADCRTAKYIMNLIDDGLNPEDDDSDTKMQVDEGALVSPERTVSLTPDWSCQIKISDFIEDSIFHEFRVDAIWCQKNGIPSPADFPLNNIVVTQVGKIPIEKLEDMMSDVHGSVLTYFSIESAFEQWKVVRMVAAYGHKARFKAFALKMEISPATKYDVYLIPPGASINSKENLYWPKRRLPRDLNDRKQIYGFLKVRHL